MSCGCDMVKYIKKQRNIYYINSTLPASATAEWTIGFPSMPQNIKANNCLINIDKMVLSSPVDTTNDNLYPTLVQTTIPSANCLSGNINANGPGSYEMPSTSGFAELIPLVDHQAGALLSSYVKNNNDRRVMCANPFGQQFKIILYNVREDTGARDRDDQIVGQVLNTVGALNITFRIELLEEET